MKKFIIRIIITFVMILASRLLTDAYVVNENWKWNFAYLTGVLVLTVISNKKLN